MVKILLLGNSFTYYHDMPATLAALAGAAGIQAQTEAVTFGGASWRQYLPGGKYVLEAAKALAAGPWDFVVLQEQSQTPLTAYEEFFRNGGALIDAAESMEARVLLYQTWAYEQGSEKLLSTGMTYGEMAEGLRYAYAALAEEKGVPVAPVGEAFYEAAARGIPLYEETDHYHPSENGSYLAACVLFAAIFGKSPEEAPFNGALPPEAAARLRRIAAEITC